MLDPIEHAVYLIRNAPVRRYPFPHFVVEDVFPLDFFHRLRDEFDGAIDFKAKDDNPNRFYGQSAVISLQAPNLAKAVLAKFNDEIVALNLPQPTTLGVIARAVRDNESYVLAPYTDDAVKMISVLFYMDDGEGTSLYLPKDRTLTSTGDAKHKRVDFDLIYTVPRKPNSALGFVKSDRSWHGVEHALWPKRIRDSIMYIITTGLSPESVETYSTKKES